MLDELNVPTSSLNNNNDDPNPNPNSVAVAPSLEPVLEPTAATPTSEQPPPPPPSGTRISQSLSEDEAHPITSATLPQLEEEVTNPSDSSNPNSSSIGSSATGQPDPYAPLATATLDTTVFDVVHMFSERGISAVPILDEDGMVVDLYETVDVIVSWK